MPDTAIAAPPGIGHNLPKPLTAAEVRAYLADQYAPLADRRAKLLAAIDRFNAANPQIQDDETQGRAADFVKQQLNGFVKQCTDGHKAEKEPFLEGGRAVDEHFRELRVPIEKGAAGIKNKAAAYAIQVEARARAEREAAAAEAARIADDLAAKAAAAMQAEAPAVDPDAAIDAAQQAALEADRANQAARAKPADLTRTRGDYGSTFSATVIYEFEVENLFAFLGAIINGLVPTTCISLEAGAIKKLIAASKGKPVPGLKITESRSVR